MQMETIGLDGERVEGKGIGNFVIKIKKDNS